MSYPKDLDEYEDSELYAELSRRTKLRQEGLCSYCKQKVDSKPCKCAAQHNLSYIEYYDYKRRAEQFNV